MRLIWGKFPAFLFQNQLDYLSKDRVPEDLVIEGDYQENQFYIMTESDFQGFYIFQVIPSLKELFFLSTNLQHPVQ